MDDPCPNGAGCSRIVRLAGAAILVGAAVGGCGGSDGDAERNDSQLSQVSQASRNACLAIANPDFELGDTGAPASWRQGEYQPTSTFAWEDGAGLDGSKAVSIESTEPNDAFWLQTLTVKPGTPYTVLGYAKGRDISPEGATGANISILGGFDGSDGHSGTFDWTELGMTFTGPESASVDLAVRLGFYGSTVTGKAWFDQLSIHELERLGGKHVYLVLEPSDVAAASRKLLRRWLVRLDDTYEALRRLVGAAPYEGEDIGVLSVQQYPGGWAVAGNPIRWQERYVPGQLEAFRDRGDWSFGILHELSHDFDIGGWNWNGEFFANFKMYYVVDKLHATVSPNGVYYRGRQLKAYYKTDSPGSYDANFPVGRFTYDALTYCFIRIVDHVGWRPFQETFRYFDESGDDPPTKLEKFRRFLDELSAFSNTDVRDTFGPGELALAEAGIAADE